MSLWRILTLGGDTGGTTLIIHRHGAGDTAGIHHGTRLGILHGILRGMMHITGTGTGIILTGTILITGLFTILSSILVRVR